MYVVRTWASWSLRETSPHVPTIWGTFDTLGAAIRAREDSPFPIVDVLDIGTAGRCPRRGTAIGADGNPNPLGHRFDVQTGTPANRPGDARCSDCGAWQDELYRAGTYVPRPVDNSLMNANNATCECCGALDVYTHGLCPRCIEGCTGRMPHVEPIM
jgi:hypothetical protein